MFEKQTIPPGIFEEAKFLDITRYVLVNKFTEESYAKFVTDCEKILNTGQYFLPIVIDSYGGYVYSLLGMIDFLASCNVTIMTICESKGMSCGSILFSCGEERYIGANCTIMVHDVSTMLWGKEVELTNDVKETSRLNRRIYSVLDKNTGQKSGYWRNLVKNNKYTDLYLTAANTKKHNLATIIGIPHLETTVSAEVELVL